MVVALQECSFTPYLLGVKAVMATHKFTYANTDMHAKNTSIDCQTQSPQSMLYVHAEGMSKKERERK